MLTLKILKSLKKLQNGLMLTVPIRKKASKMLTKKTSISANKLLLQAQQSNKYLKREKICSMHPVKAK